MCTVCHLEWLVALFVLGGSVLSVWMAVDLFRDGARLAATRATEADEPEPEGRAARLAAGTRRQVRQVLDANAQYDTDAIGAGTLLMALLGAGVLVLLMIGPFDWLVCQ